MSEIEVGEERLGGILDFSAQLGILLGVIMLVMHEIMEIPVRNDFIRIIGVAFIVCAFSALGSMVGLLSKLPEWSGEE